MTLTYGGFLMDKMLNSFIQCRRYCRSGKKEFIENIKSWTHENLDSFNLSIERNILVCDYRELSKIIFLFINFIILFFITQGILINQWIVNIILFIYMYSIQFRLVFLFLCFFTPSKNVILSKTPKNNSDKTKEIIICAHYDTKNSIFKRPKGIIKSFLKFNIYNISRIITKYINVAEKVLLPASITVYFLYLSNFNTTIQTSFQIWHNPLFFLSFIQGMGMSFLVCSIFCTLLIYLISYPYFKQIKNPAADDNTSGLVGALEVAKRLNNIDIDVRIKIILFDNEEIGLIGSRHFVAKNIKSLKSDTLGVVNLDCIGRGEDIYIMTDNRNNKLLKSISESMNNLNTKFSISNIDYSDHKPFLWSGIDAISFGRYNTKKYLWLKKFPVIDWIHGSEDCIEEIDINKIEEAVKTVTHYIINKSGQTIMSKC